MRQVCPCLVLASDGVTSRHLTVAEPGDLRKDVPHPVRALAASPDFSQRFRITGFLRVHKTLQIVRIAHD